MGWQEVLSGERLWSVEQGDCLEFLRALPADCVDAVVTSPPYEQARLYLENSKDMGIARDTESWVAWLIEVCVELRRVCKGLCVLVVEGQTRDYRYSAGPLILAADLHRRGFHLRKPPIYRRIGIPGSGGSDWLRNDYEFCIAFARGGKLPWSDNTACGHPPKWAPGGEMSNRMADGSRVNQWGMRVRKDGSLTASERSSDADDDLKRRSVRPSHRVVSGAQEPAVGLFGEPLEEKAADKDEFGISRSGSGMRLPDGKRREHGKPHTKRRAGKEASRQDADGDTERQTYHVPVLANPGNVIQAKYTAQEVADMLGEQTDIIDCKVGGGLMGSKRSHVNEAPFPEALVEPLILSFCPPGGIILEPFLGSGTTIAVALRHGRRGIGVDLRQSQVDNARERIASETPTMFPAG